MIEPGTRLGSYEVLGSLGAGGMGEVYRARDTRLGRDVALKIVPDAFANDPDRRTRFQREAQILASLNHANIAAIYGVEDTGGTRALILELVEGPTLADRIAQGPLALDEAVPIATQIAEALETAHELGIIHRDLKPANIKLRPDGTVKILDFGLAKMLDPAGADRGPADSGTTNSPTISIGATQAGLILGTAAYMAPEQARGRPVDKRVDVWAFGAVLYEMLTGKMAFRGEDVSDTLAAVLKFEPDWSLLPADTPSSIARLLQRCLAKDPRLRLRECGSAILDLRDATHDSSSHLASPQSRTRRRSALVVGIVVLVLVTAAAFASWQLKPKATVPAAQTTRFTITLPESDELAAGTGGLLALSPDGRTLVYRATRQGSAQLFRRSLDQFESAPIPGTDSPNGPFFSADGQSVAFVADLSLKKIDLVGGLPQVLATLETPTRGMVWTPDGHILYGVNTGRGALMQVSASGGPAVELFTTGDTRRIWYPALVPDAQAVLFTVAERQVADSAELFVLKLGTRESRRVLPAASAGRVLPSGHLVFIRSGGLWAVPFDRQRLEPVGTPVSVVNGVRVEGGGAVQFDVADDGSLVYIPGIQETGASRKLVILAADGHSTVLDAPERDYSALALSPDQTRVAVQIGEGDLADVWVTEIGRGTLTRITADPGFDGGPLWTPDSRQIVYASMRDGHQELRQKSADGTGPSKLLTSFDPLFTRVRPYSWSADGSTLLFEMNSVKTGSDIGAIPAAGGNDWTPVIQTRGSELRPAISPDGRWLAYDSFETGAFEVYLQRFPELGDRQLVSFGAGFSPLWSRQPLALFYLRGSPPDALVRLKVGVGTAGRLVLGKPDVFASLRQFVARSGRAYDVFASGDRVVTFSRGTNDAATTTTARQINVVLNWTEELKRLVPIK